MESTNLVVDTNIFIEYLRAKNKEATVLFQLPETVKLFVSSVTMYELYMGANSVEKKNDVKLITEDLVKIPFDELVVEHAAEIYHDLKRASQIIEFRDIFIAATCIAYDLPLKTLNAKHFSRINKLNLL